MISIKLESYFAINARNDGSKYFCFGENTPQWLSNAVHESLSQSYHIDWGWKIIHQLVLIIDEDGIPDEDGIHAFCEANVSPFTKDIFQWATDYCLTDTFSLAEESANDVGLEGSASNNLSLIQFYAIELIASVFCEHVAKQFPEDK